MATPNATATTPALAVFRIFLRFIMMIFLFFCFFGPRILHLLLGARTLFNTTSSLSASLFFIFLLFFFFFFFFFAPPFLPFLWGAQPLFTPPQSLVQVFFSFFFSPIKP